MPTEYCCEFFARTQITHDPDCIVARADGSLRVIGQMVVPAHTAPHADRVQVALVNYAEACSNYNRAEDADPGFTHRPPEWYSARMDEAESALITAIRAPLRAENARLRAALEAVTRAHTRGYVGPSNENGEVVLADARAALAATTPEAK